ncbi:MAG TPA: type II toxin-antitoxin system VapC family toxin [Terriglobales bacterium]|nr:type II toxin-antitoxin system VapC family toxin [Terriglobales bacterium]
MTTYLDTHVLIWLAEGELEKIGNQARAMIQSCEVLACPMAVLELQLLHEIGKLRWSGAAIAEQLSRDIGLQISSLGFDEVAAAACNESWTRDPFDRLIVAQARASALPLITKDKMIHAHFAAAVW